MKRVLQVVETTTKKVVREIDVTEFGPRGTEKLESRVNFVLDRERFHTKVVPALPKEKGKVDR